MEWNTLGSTTRFSSLTSPFYYLFKRPNWFSWKTDIGNFADNTTFCVCDSSLDSFAKRLEHNPNLAIELFNSKCMKVKQGKFHLMVSSHKFEAICTKIAGQN